MDTQPSNHWLTDPDPSHEQLLYHYTSAETLDRILDSGTLRFGPYSGTNDPRETKEWVPDIILAAGGVTTEVFAAVEHARAETDRLLRRGARLGCFTVDTPARVDAGTEPGGLFHRGWARARMWDQYAGKHTGACLIFDRSELLEQFEGHEPLTADRKRTWGRVVYRDRCLDLILDMGRVGAVGLSRALDDLQKDAILKELYFIKNRDWESEAEFRVAVMYWDLPEATEQSPVFVPYGLALKGVVLGEHFNNAVEWTERHGGALKEVDCVQCVWERGCPDLTALQLNGSSQASA